MDRQPNSNVALPQQASDVSPTFVESLQRIQAMAEDDDGETWDLSDNDQMALGEVSRFVVWALSVFAAGLPAVGRDSLADEGRDALPAEIEQVKKRLSEKAHRLLNDPKADRYHVGYADGLLEAEERLKPSPSPALAGRPDYSKQTVVQFTIEPPIDESRWKALHAAAQAAGAVSGHINPPALAGREQIEKLIAEWTAKGRSMMESHDSVDMGYGAGLADCADQLAALLAGREQDTHEKPEETAVLDSPTKET